MVCNSRPSRGAGVGETLDLYSDRATLISKLLVDHYEIKIPNSNATHPKSHMAIETNIQPTRTLCLIANRPAGGNRAQPSCPRRRGETHEPVRQRLS
jgi:hypothetical protein